MSVSNFVDYQPNDHYITRAEQRFGIEPAKALKWFRSLQQQLTKRQTEPNGREHYVSPDGIIFVLDPSVKTIVTVFRDDLVNDQGESRKSKRITTFEAEVEDLRIKHRHTYVKELLGVLGDDLDILVDALIALRDKPVSKPNRKHLETIDHHYSRVAKILKVIAYQSNMP